MRWRRSTACSLMQSSPTWRRSCWICCGAVGSRRLRATSPELTERDRLARRVAAFRLHQDDHEAISISQVDWQLLMPTLYQQRLTGFAVAATEAGSLTLTSGQAEELLERHREGMLQVLALERHLVTLSA